MGSCMTPKENIALKKFTKIQNACTELRNSMEIIYENALTEDELTSLTTGSEIEKFIAFTPACMISTYLANARSSVDIVKICDYYKFDENIWSSTALIKEPIITNPILEFLVLAHKKLQKSNTAKNNELLQFVGDSWLKSLIASILYKKFPHASAKALEKLKSDLLTNETLDLWSANNRLLKSLPDLVTKMHPNASEEEVLNYRRSCFKAYIGALILDRSHHELNDVVSWLSSLCETRVGILKAQNLRGLYAKNLKEQLVQFMEGNKSEKPLKFITTHIGASHSCKVVIGSTVLGTARGVTAVEAERKAASIVLGNVELLTKYTVYSDSVPIYQKPLASNNSENSEEKAVIAESEAVKENENAENERAKIFSPIDDEKLTEHILSKLSERLESMVSEITLKILQEKNISSPDNNENSTKPVPDAPIATVSTENTENGSVSELHAEQKEPVDDLMEPNFSVAMESEEPAENLISKGLDFASNNPATLFNKVKQPEVSTKPVEKREFSDATTYHNRTHLNSFIPDRKLSTPPMDEPVNNSNPHQHIAIPPLPAMIERKATDAAHVKEEVVAQKSAETNDHQSPVVSRQYEHAAEHPQSNASLTGASKLPLQHQFDKTAKAQVYGAVGRLNMFPEYVTVQLGVNDFYSCCSIKGEPDSLMGEGRGFSKKIAEQVAAGAALQSDKWRILSEKKKKAAAALFGVDILEDTTDDPMKTGNKNEVDHYKHFQPEPEPEVEKPIVHTSCDKTAMGRLQALLGEAGFIPEYKTRMLAPSHFYSTCNVRGTSVLLAEGHGLTKLVSQQIAAENAMFNSSIDEFLED
ncbi:uncharacterized protein KNAG_0C00210 [Huiozyma naganishii CBS 8797]|uniref:RNase III domain-containing protein n=1 Tax=Huiozyma naganishii (strain ATCC MYA-139 / BCRC 22969 / CBS 8797 / KCTC 17520 / NBRC 10181 / NCYC 3082 / Yp74L-3) TaxID=1071383 RepID=J7S477_HUIN7|nr:hypothetical protein KNAG_0C00210 [Kazachstania naganishii CBS 8797]CCK69134.1 hypothetical protein KNAG_0C00210 [Kazachstania naganishii CBS 8797]